MPNKKSLSEWIPRDFPFVLFKVCLFIICHRFLHSDGHYFQVTSVGTPNMENLLEEIYKNSPRSLANVPTILWAPQRHGFLDIRAGWLEP